MTTYSPDNMHAIWQAIQHAKTITLLTHQYPDADGASACAAFELVAQALGKQTETVYPTPPNSFLPFESGARQVNHHTMVPDLIIAFDAANTERLYRGLLDKNIPLINIDHHVSNPGFGTYNLVDPTATSCCEVLFRLLNECCPDAITAKIAQRLLTGIVYDTQLFYVQGTGAETLRVCADLIERGANLYTCQTALFSHKNPHILALWGVVLSRITISKNKKAAWTSITRADLEKHALELGVTAGLVNLMAQISDIDVVALFTEVEENVTKVSLRSKHTDVNAFAAPFGGGGHIHASGITLQEPIAHGMSRIISALEELA